MALRAMNRTNARNRAALDPSVPERNVPAVIDNIEATAADAVRLTFSHRVVTSKNPGYKAGADAAETVSSMVRVSDTVVDLTFTGEVQGTDLIIQGGDPGLRTSTGGFVPAGTYAIPTFP